MAYAEPDTSSRPVIINGTVAD